MYYNIDIRTLLIWAALFLFAGCGKETVTEQMTVLPLIDDFESSIHFVQEQYDSFDAESLSLKENRFSFRMLALDGNTGEASLTEFTELLDGRALIRFRKRDLKGLAVDRKEFIPLAETGIRRLAGC